MMTTNTQQLELGINGCRGRTARQRNKTSLARGQWWFARMRETVENAVDWQAMGAHRATQWLPEVNRELKLKN